MRHKKKPAHIYRHRPPLLSRIGKLRLRWFIAGILSALAIIILIGAFSPIRMAGFVTLFSNRDPVIAESTAEITETSILARDVFVLINETRQEHGLQPLEWSNELANMATSHCKYMAKVNILTHSGYAGGENCIQLIGYDFIGAQDFVEGWMESPLHKKNILGNYSITGVGLVEDGNTWWGTQIFIPGWKSTIW